MSTAPDAAIAPTQLHHRMTPGSNGRCQDGYWADLGHGWVLLVDGGGPDDAGEQVTQATVAFFSAQLPLVADADAEVPALFAAANQAVRAAVPVEGASASVLVARLRTGDTKVWHVGNVRAYRLRDGAAEALTTDHTLVAMLVERGQLTAEMAKTHPAARSLTRFIGNKRDPEPDGTVVELHEGDRLLLAAIGTFAALAEPEILAKLATGDCAQGLDLLAQQPTEDDRTAVLYEAIRHQGALGAGGNDLLRPLFEILTTTQDPEQVLERILGLAVTLAQGDRGFIFLTDSAGELECRVRFGSFAPLAGDAISQSVVKKVRETGKAIWLKDALSDQTFGQQESILALKLHTVLCVPIRGGTAQEAGADHEPVAGVLYIDRTTPMQDGGDLQHLEVLAHYAGTLIQNSALQADLSVQNDRLQVLNALGRILSGSSDIDGILHDILVYALQVTGADEAVVLMGQPMTPYYALDRDGDLLDEPHISQSAVQRVIDELKPVFVLDASQDALLASQASVMAFALRSVMGVPLYAAGRLEGVLYLSGRVAANRLNKLDLEFLEILSSQASVALTNARQFQRLEDENAELRHRLGLPV